MQNITCLLLLFLSVFSCKPKSALTVSELSATQQIVFLDSISASKAIITDEREHFFDKIQSLEMSIQMKKETVADNRGEVLDDYKAFLQADTESFTESEKQFVAEVFREAYDLTAKVNAAVFPAEIRLIKTKGTHYGNSVYYTRENIIVIPANVLEEQNRTAFLQVMLHEIFHIYSRYNADKRNRLYELIGFKPLEARLVFPPKLERRLLYNPDGIDVGYYMTVTDKTGNKMQVVPLIYSEKDAYSSEVPGFFDYVNFNLFPILYEEGNFYDIQTDENGLSPLDLKELPDFFTQIKDNTQYIIHPDEILADNFAYVILAEKKEGKFKGYSPEGTWLLLEIRQILRE